MTGYNKIFWGFLLVLLTFRVRSIANTDILPAFIGFLLIHFALGDLADREPRFVEARKFTLPLFLISLFFFIQFDLGLVTMVLAVIYSGLTLLVLWHICTAIANLAAAAEHNKLQEAAQKRWKYYLVVSILTLISSLLPFLNPLLLVLIIVGFVVNIMLLVLFYQAGQVLN